MVFFGCLQRLVDCVVDNVCVHFDYDCWHSIVAVVVVDEKGVVTHSELVAEITEEPNYEAALTAL